MQRWRSQRRSRKPPPGSSGSNLGPMVVSVQRRPRQPLLMLRWILKIWKVRTLSLPTVLPSKSTSGSVTATSHRLCLILSRCGKVMAEPMGRGAILGMPTTTSIEPAVPSGLLVLPATFRRCWCSFRTTNTSPGTCTLWSGLSGVSSSRRATPIQCRRA